MQYTKRQNISIFWHARRQQLYPLIPTKKFWLHEKITRSIFKIIFWLEPPIYLKWAIHYFYFLFFLQILTVHILGQVQYFWLYHNILNGSTLIQVEDIPIHLIEGTRRHLTPVDETI